MAHRVLLLRRRLTERLSKLVTEEIGVVAEPPSPFGSSRIRPAQLPSKRRGIAPAWAGRSGRSGSVLRGAGQPRRRDDAPALHCWRRLLVRSRWRRPTAWSAHRGPPSENTSSPESSATVGSPLRRAKYSAFLRALASKVSPSSRRSSAGLGLRPISSGKTTRCRRAPARAGTHAACRRSVWPRAASPAERLPLGNEELRNPRSARSSRISSWSRAKVPCSPVPCTST